MPEDLGTRLTRAGLITREQLSAALQEGARQGGALAQTLVRLGVDEDELAGFFVADGFGPVVPPAELSVVDANVAAHLDAGMASSLLALPIQSEDGTVLIAMADPSDRHALAELRWRLGKPVRAVVARVGDISRAIAAHWPKARMASAPTGHPRPSERTQPIQLVQPRSERPAEEAPRRSDKSRPHHRLDQWGRLSDPDGAGGAGGGSREGREPTELGTIVSVLRHAKLRDEVIHLACIGAATLAQSASFFALHRSVLVGWEGAGGDVSRDALRNLRLPVSRPSILKQALESGDVYVGTYGTTETDLTLRASLHSRSDDVLVYPVVLSRRPAGVLCVDGPRMSDVGRLDALVQATVDALERIVLENKNR